MPSIVGEAEGTADGLDAVPDGHEHGDAQRECAWCRRASRSQLCFAVGAGCRNGQNGGVVVHPGTEGVEAASAHSPSMRRNRRIADG